MRRPKGLKVAGALLLTILLLGGLGWWLRDSLPFWWRREVTTVSPEAAAQAEAKLADLRESGETVRLSGVEISSLLRYRSPEWATSTVREPAVALAGDTLHLTGTVPTDRLPSHPELDRVRYLLPDSARVEVTGRLRPRGPGRVALDVQGVEFAGIPIPSRYYPVILERLGRRDEPGLARSAVVVPLPPGVGGARIEGGYLVLTP